MIHYLKQQIKLAFSRYPLIANCITYATFTTSAEFLQQSINNYDRLKDGDVSNQKVRDNYTLIDYSTLQYSLMNLLKFVNGCYTFLGLWFWFTFTIRLRWRRGVVSNAVWLVSCFRQTSARYNYENINSKGSNRRGVLWDTILHGILLW